MTERREFDAKTKGAIIKRATHEGVVRCEECRCAVSRWEIHHVKPDALEINKSAKLTPADGMLLCKHCHDELTRPFQTIIAKVKRQELKHLGARKKSKLSSAEPQRRATTPTTKIALGRPAWARRFTTEDA